MATKADVLDLLERVVAFHPVLARVAGGATPGLFISQLHYWMERASHPDGWVYKGWREWEAETCLTQGEQRGAVATLRRLGLVEVSDVRSLNIDAFSSTLCFKINYTALRAALLGPIEGETPENSGVQNLHSGEAKQQPGVRKRHPGCGKKAPHKTEISPKTSPPPPPGGGVGSFSPEDFEELRLALEDEARRKKKTDPTSWAAGGIRRIKKEGATEEDRRLLAVWRKARQARQAKEMAAAAMAAADNQRREAEEIARTAANARLAILVAAGEISRRALVEKVSPASKTTTKNRQALEEFAATGKVPPHPTLAAALRQAAVSFE